MGLFDLFRTKPQPQVRKVPQQVVALAKSRVEGLENQWYNLNRSFLSSPNTEIRASIEKTRELARLLSTIDPYAFKYLELLSVYVVGDAGMKMEPRNELKGGDLDDETNTAIRLAWEDWCDEASFDGRYSFKELEQLGIRTIGRDGEALFRIITDKNVNKYGFALHPLDPNLLDIQYNGKLGNNTVLMGVEYEGIRPVAYHIWNRYADDLAASGVSRFRDRIPASEIIHVFDDDYGNLVRGMPWLTPALKTLARLHEFLDAYLLACQVAAAAPLIMTSEDEDGPDYGDASVASYLNSDGTTGTSGGSQGQTLNLNYSQILELPANKKLEALNLNYPANGFGEATRNYLQGIASALQVSYSTLTSDHSNDSYSTTRHGSIIERDHWKQIQHWYAQRFHKKVYRAFIENAILSGALDLPSTNPQDYYKVAFKPRGFRWIDPIKDMKAYVEGIQHGFYTHEQVVAEMGGDWRDNIKSLQSEQKFALEHSVTLPELPAKLDVLQQIQDLAQTPTKTEN